MGDRLAHVHLADGTGSAKDEHLVPGRGTQPCAELLEGLAGAGFDGHVVIEVNTRRAMSAAEREADLAEALAFTRLHLAPRPRTVPAGRDEASGPRPPRSAPHARGRPARGRRHRPGRPGAHPGGGPRRSSPTAATTRPRCGPSPRRQASTRRWSTTTSARRSRSSRRRSRSPSNPRSACPACSAGGPDGMGERLARFILAVWENPVTRAPLLAIMRSALTQRDGGGGAARLRAARLLDRVAGELDVPDAEFRAQLAASHMIGIAMLRYVIQAEPLASADPEKIVAMVAPTLQRYLTAA